MKTNHSSMTGGLLLWVFMILALGGPLAIASMTMEHPPVMTQHANADFAK